MGRELQRLKRRQKTLEKVAQLIEQEDTTLIVHYSCESFYDKTDGKTPRITSIAVRNLDSGQADSFSIHQIAEEKGILFTQIPDLYDELESQMLGRFYDFVTMRQHYNWVHWNMRDVNYGFAAIEHRYRVLGGTPISILENRKFDLSRALNDIYGRDYIGHPRLASIISKNDITEKDMLAGPQEAEAFDKQEFIRLHQSTLRKVTAISRIFELSASKSLKTNSSWINQNGLTPGIISELLRENWLVALMITGGGILTFILRSLDAFQLLLK